MDVSLLTVEAMGTVVGLAFALELVMEGLLKPALAGSEGAPWYGRALNLCGFVIAWGLSIVAQWATAGLVPADVLACLLTALGATAVATLGYEVVKNVRTAKNGT